MGWTLFDHDWLTGRKVWMMLDGDKTHWRIELPIDGLAEANAEAEKATHGRRFGDYNRIASVPLNILEKYKLDEAVKMGDNRYLSKWFNDPDYMAFRTSRGRV